MQKHIIYFLKLAWVVAVIIFIALFFKDKSIELIYAVKQIRTYYLFLAFFFILGAKALLPLFMQCVVFSINKSMNFWTCFRIYTITQLGKYIPGNIWHFVGKAAAYKHQGFSAGNIKDALIIENIWLVLSAFVYGLILVLIFEYDLIKSFFFSYIFFLIIFIILALLCFIVSQKLLKIDFGKIFSDYKLNSKIIIIQFFVWTLLGFGFVVLITPFLPQEASIFMIVGLYAIAYSIGFITPFAPAGIGVREGVLAFGLMPYVSLEVVIIVSMANRLLYLLVEIILASVVQLVSKPARM